MVSRAVDSLITYRILSLLATPFEKTKAFELGLIDEKGNLIKKPSTSEEKDAYSLLTKMVFNIKKLFQKIPRGARAIATYAAALKLIKDHYEISESDMDLIIEEVNKMGNVKILKETLQKATEDDIMKIQEEIANVAGGDNIAGFKNPPKPDCKFRNCPVFDVDSDVFRRDTFEKKKRKHFKKYLGLNNEDMDGVGEKIRQYAKAYPKESIIIRDRATGAMRYIKHGK